MMLRRYAFLLLIFSITVMQCGEFQPDDNGVEVNPGELLSVGFLTEWKPGIPGGIPDVTTIHTTLSPGATVSDINNAIQAAGNVATASNRQVVQLNAGTYNLNGNIALNRPNVILRGAGQRQTTLIFSNSPDYNTGFISIGYLNWWNGANTIRNVTNSPKVGDTSIVVDNASGLSAGNILVLDRHANDNGDRTGGKGGTEWPNDASNFLRGNAPTGSNGPASPSGRRPVKQYIEIASISGNTLHLANRINIDFPSNLQPQVWRTNAHSYKGIGLEDLTIQPTNGGGHTPAIHMHIESSYSWVKSVEIDGQHGFYGVHIRMRGFRNTVSGCFVHHSARPSYGGTAYGIEIMGGDGIIENNIADYLNKPILGYASSGGNVIAYNFVGNTTIDGPNNSYGYPDGTGPWLETAIDASHQAYSHSDLYEGNYAPNIATDSNDGNNGWMIFFRNHAWGRNLNGKTNSNIRAMCIGAYSTEHASIGNVLLAPDRPNNSKLWNRPGDAKSGNQQMVVYQIGASPGWGPVSGQPFDTVSGYPQGLAFSRFYRHLDFNYVEDEVYENPASDVITLPNSLYLTSAPAFFAGFTWPPVNPFGADHNQRVNLLPAEDRYNKMKNY